MPSPTTTLERGHVFICEGVNEVTGEFISGNMEFDIIGCRHCSAAIKIVLSGVNADMSTPYSCFRCNGPICKFCAENLKGADGNCYPMMAQVKYKLKNGRWPWQNGILDYGQLPLDQR